MEGIAQFGDHMAVGKTGTDAYGHWVCVMMTIKTEWTDMVKKD